MLPGKQRSAHSHQRSRNAVKTIESLIGNGSGFLESAQPADRPPHPG